MKGSRRASKRYSHSYQYTIAVMLKVAQGRWYSVRFKACGHSYFRMAGPHWWTLNQSWYSSHVMLHVKSYSRIVRSHDKRTNVATRYVPEYEWSIPVPDMLYLYMYSVRSLNSRIQQHNILVHSSRINHTGIVSLRHLYDVSISEFILVLFSSVLFLFTGLAWVAIILMPVFSYPARWPFTCCTHEICDCFGIYYY